MPLTDLEIEQMVRSKHRKYTGKDKYQIIDAEIVELKSIRDAAYKAKFNDVPFDKPKNNN